MRSDIIKRGAERAPHRGLLRSTGVIQSDADFDKPFIAIANSYTDVVPGHVHLKKFAEVVKAAVRKAMSGFGGAKKVDIPEGATSRPRTRHQIMNHVIDVDGNKAKTIAYWFAMTNNTPQKDVQLLYFGHYEDTLEKINGKWLFKSRHVYNESQPNRAVYYPGLGEKDPRVPAKK